MTNLEMLYIKAREKTSDLIDYMEAASNETTIFNINAYEYLYKILHKIESIYHDYTKTENKEQELIWIIHEVEDIRKDFINQLSEYTKNVKFDILPKVENDEDIPF